MTADKANKIHIKVSLVVIFFYSYVLRVPFLPERANTTSDSHLRALICLSEMVSPLPDGQAKCWPLLTLVLSPHCAKCYLWCHICPRKWSKTAAPRVSIEIPHGISSSNPERLSACLPACLFLPLQHTLRHTRRDGRYHTPHWRLPAWGCLILQPQKQLFVWLNLSSLSATVFVSFSTVQYLFSLILSE